MGVTIVTASRSSLPSWRCRWCNGACRAIVTVVPTSWRSSPPGVRETGAQYSVYTITGLWP